MKVLIDTNILFSAILFPNSKPAKVLFHVSRHYQMVLCDQNIYEFYDIIKRKAPKFLNNGRTLLNNLSFIMIEVNDDGQADIRDQKDRPILNAAIEHEVDIIVTGDKDFLSLGIKKPKCITADEYCRIEDI